MIQCAQCGKDFAPKRPHHKFCSKTCRKLNFTDQTAAGIPAEVVSIKVSNGSVMVQCNIADGDRERAIKLKIGQKVRLV